MQGCPNNKETYISETDKRETEEKGSFTGKDSETSIYTFEEFLFKHGIADASDKNGAVKLIEYYIRLYKSKIKNIEVIYNEDTWIEIVSELFICEGHYKDLEIDFETMFKAITKHFDTNYNHKEMYYLHNFKGEVKRNRLYEVGVL